MRTLILMSVCAVGLCGCAQNLDAPLSPTFGRAVASMDTQIIPTPISSEPPSGSGVHGAAAIGRYDKGQVYKPETQNTSNVTSYSSSSGGK
ncbi:hypothetical protein LJR225_002386 [Phenylobacterium sp. LjRoot225]|uniref:hypothetical protein n=1 Tax=Phenylobacterium sp. LjRoot225 TaxID=3342285 RepID=UPI003ECC1BF0